MSYDSIDKKRAYSRNYYHTVLKKKFKDSKITGGKIEEKDIQIIIDRYISGESTYKISKSYMVDKTIILRILVKYNIPRRNNIELCKSRKRQANPNYNGYEEITGTKWGFIKHAAKIRNLEFNITIKEAWELFIKQGRRCALTGDILIFALDTVEMFDKITTASLDRIDSSKGYTLDNVQWVHKTVNLMKRELNQQDFIDICNKISHYNKEK